MKKTLRKPAAAVLFLFSSALISLLIYSVITLHSYAVKGEAYFKEFSDFVVWSNMTTTERELICDGKSTEFTKFCAS